MIGDEIPTGTLACKQAKIEELEAEIVRLNDILKQTATALAEMIGKFDRTLGTP